jgi:stage III sporulation protein AH
MVLKKQTIWLLTMLTLMVVLSAYYLFTGDNEEIDVTQAPNQNNESGSMVGEEDNGVAESEGLASNDMGVEIDTVQSTAAEDLFSNLRLSREQNRGKLMDKYYSIMQTSQDKNEVAEATAKYDELEALESTEATVESLIKAKGYTDAVVQKINDKVEVTVQAESLDNDEVVSLIDLVAEHLNVPGVNVRVSYIQ